MNAVLDHVGIAVRDLERALAFYRDSLGLQVEAAEEVPSQRVRVQFVQTGPSLIELLEPTADDSPVASFLAKRGPGLHHVALRVPDIEAALARLRSGGVRVIDEVPRPGAHGTRVAFVHPSGAEGVLVELVERR